MSLVRNFHYFFTITLTKNCEVNIVFQEDRGITMKFEFVDVLFFGHC